MSNILNTYAKTYENLKEINKRRKQLLKNHDALSYEYRMIRPVNRPENIQRRLNTMHKNILENHQQYNNTLQRLKTMEQNIRQRLPVMNYYYINPFLGIINPVWQPGNKIENIIYKSVSRARRGREIARTLKARSVIQKWKRIAGLRSRVRASHHSLRRPSQTGNRRELPTPLVNRILQLALRNQN